MEKKSQIPGGATLWARQTIDSEIFYDKPDKWFKIWFYLVNRVAFLDDKRHKRGELFLKYEWICDKTKATKNQVDSFMRWAKSTDMLTTQKTTRGMIVKIANYSKYQTLDNYYYNIKTDTENDFQPKQNRNRTDTIQKNDKNDKNITKVIEQSSDELEYILEEPIKKRKPIRKDINNVYNFLKENLGATPDGSIAENRKYAKLLIDRLKKDYPTFNSEEQIKFLIKTGLKDKFHSKNLTSFKYLYYNAQKIIQSIKTKSKITII